MFDPKKRQHRITYAQNFLNNPSLARYIVSKSKITEGDTVVEIGPGRGILTTPLFGKTKNLILVEKDRELCEGLREKYSNEPTIKIICADAREFRIPLGEYKVFSNPPFMILSQLVKKFAFAPNSPTEMYVFMQKEAYRRLSGKPQENQLSILLKTWYRIKELHQFKPTDFSPVPSVNVALIAFYKRAVIAIDETEKANYTQFVAYGFQQQKANLAKNFGRIFTHDQWKRLSETLGFALDCQPTNLTPDQWVGLFHYYKTGVALEKQRILQTFRPRE